jgi:hypothetical protein
MEGTINSKEMSHFACKEGITVQDRISIDTEVIFEIDSLKVPMIEHLDDSISTTLLSKQAQ